MRMLEIFENSDEQKIADFTDRNGVRHILYSFYSSEIENFFKPKKLVIADGHHRYEAALKYADEAGSLGSSYILAVLVNKRDPGLIILPSHRVIEVCDINPKLLLARIEKYFDIIKISRDSIKRLVDEDLIFVSKESVYSLSFKKEYAKDLSFGERLNVSVLNKYILSNILDLESGKGIRYVRWPDEAFALIDSNNAKFAFLIKPLTPDIVWKVAMEGETLPQKSTDFYPKIISGLLLYDLTSQ